MANVDFKPQMSLGTTGLKESGGFVHEDFLARLRGPNAIKIYNEMRDNCTVIASAINVIKWMIRQAEWRIEPADESKEALEQAEDTENALLDMNHTFEDFVSESLSMVDYGWAFLETVYKIRKGETGDPATDSMFNDGKWGWRKFEIRGQNTLYRWGFNDEGEITGMEQFDQCRQMAGGPVFIPIEKALLFRTESLKNNPEGRSMLRPAAIPYWYLKRIQQFEAIGIERDLAGMPIMEVPPEILMPGGDEQAALVRAECERFVTQVRVDERWGGLVPSEVKEDGSPSGYKFKLLTTGGKRKIETNEIVARYESRILMLFVAQFLIMGIDKVGSYASTYNMSHLFAIGIGHLMDIICSTFNRFAIRRRQAMNGLPRELDPKLVHGDIDVQDLGELGTYVNSLAAAGILSPNASLERKLLETAKLPQPPEETMPVSTDDDDGIQPPTPQADDAVEAKAALNGAQIKSMIDVLQAVAEKRLPRGSGLKILTTAFPIDEKRAEELMGEIGRGFTIRPEE